MSRDNDAGGRVVLHTDGGAVQLNHEAMVSGRVYTFDFVGEPIAARKHPDGRVDFWHMSTLGVWEALDSYAPPDSESSPQK